MVSVLLFVEKLEDAPYHDLEFESKFIEIRPSLSCQEFHVLPESTGPIPMIF